MQILMHSGLSQIKRVQRKYLMLLSKTQIEIRIIPHKYTKQLELIKYFFTDFS